jgi:hypothetical protein
VLRFGHVDLRLIRFAALQFALEGRFRARSCAWWFLSAPHMDRD